MTYQPFPPRRVHRALALALALGPALPAAAQPGGAHVAGRGNPLVALPPATPATQPTGTLVNLIHNGDFKQPNATSDGPAVWQPVDNLVWHWTNDPDAPERGKVLKVDTGIDEHFAYKWWVDHFIKGVPLAKAPPKPPGDAGYGSIGGNDGGWFFSSDLIPIKPGRAYRVYVDAKGPTGKVFIRGYEKPVPISFGDEEPATEEVFSNARGEPKRDASGRPIRHYLRYSYYKWFSVGGSNQWKTYTSDKPAHPTERQLTKNVRYIRIQLYPYWPNAVYWYDNIRVYEVDPDPQITNHPPTEADYREGKVMRPATGPGSVPETQPAH